MWEIKIVIFENLALKTLRSTDLFTIKYLRISINKIKIPGKVVASTRRAK